MRRLHELHLQYPWMGSRGLRHQLGRAGFAIGRDQVRRLMRRLSSSPDDDSGARPQALPVSAQDLVIERPNRCGRPT